MEVYTKTFFDEEHRKHFLKTRIQFSEKSIRQTDFSSAGNSTNFQFLGLSVHVVMLNSDSGQFSFTEELLFAVIWYTLPKLIARGDTTTTKVHLDKSIFKIGSISPAAWLYEALDHFDRQSNKAGDFLLAGCKVADGNDVMMDTSVGSVFLPSFIIDAVFVFDLGGKKRREVDMPTAVRERTNGLKGLGASIFYENGGETPLQVCLNGIATFISSIELAVAAAVMVILVNLIIMLNGQSVDVLATTIHKQRAYRVGKQLVERLKNYIERQMFEVLKHNKTKLPKRWWFKYKYVEASGRDIVILAAIIIQVEGHHENLEDKVFRGGEI